MLHACEGIHTPRPEASSKVLSECDQCIRRRVYNKCVCVLQNVFVVTKSPFWWVKLADLGISKRVQGDSTALYTRFDGMFMAPEVLGFGPDTDAGQYTKAVDMWALGSLAYWLLTLQIAVPRQSMFALCNGKKELSMSELQVRRRKIYWRD